MPKAEGGVGRPKSDRCIKQRTPHSPVPSPSGDLRANLCLVVLRSCRGDPCGRPRWRLQVWPDRSYRAGDHKGRPYTSAKARRAIYAQFSGLREPCNLRQDPSDIRPTDTWPNASYSQIHEHAAYPTRRIAAIDRCHPRWQGGSTGHANSRLGRHSPTRASR